MATEELAGTLLVNRYEAYRIAKRFMQGYQPPIECAHKFSRWYGLILRWRRCSECPAVELTLSR